VVYTAANNITMKKVSTDGSTTTVGDAITVNDIAGTSDQPDVAALADGRAVVVWHNEGKIYFQRFDATQQKVSGDQDSALTVSSPVATFPVVAASPAEAGSSFAAAWSADDGTIWARFIGADTGFGYNSVTGQNDDFLASHPDVTGNDVGLRSRPTVAIGGGGHVAIGWQNLGPNNPGVFVRRFPLPK